MKNRENIEERGHGGNHDFVYEMFEFMNKMSKFEIKSITNEDEKGATFKVNGFDDEAGYKKNLVIKKEKVINQLKDYLVFYPLQEQLEILEKLKFKLVLLWENAIVV